MNTQTHLRRQAKVVSQIARECFAIGVLLGVIATLVVLRALEVLKHG